MFFHTYHWKIELSVWKIIKSAQLSRFRVMTTHHIILLFFKWIFLWEYKQLGVLNIFPHSGQQISLLLVWILICCLICPFFCAVLLHIVHWNTICPLRLCSLMSSSLNLCADVVDFFLYFCDDVCDLFTVDLLFLTNVILGSSVFVLLLSSDSSKSSSLSSSWL